MVSLLVFSYINYTGIRESINYNNISTIIEITGLIFIILLGIKNVNSSIFDIRKIKSTEISSILLGSALIYFAFIGYDVIIELTEETKNSRKVIPRAMMTGVGISTLLYVLIGSNAM